MYSNGETVFKLRDVFGKSSVIWNFEAPPGTQDTHFSLFRGTKSDLVIRQDATTEYKPVLFVEPHGRIDREQWEADLADAMKEIHQEWPDVSFGYTDDRFRIDIPEKYKVGHEAHFTEVTKKFLSYLKEGSLPQWEKDFMLTKYYITTQAYEKSLQDIQ